MKNSSLETNVCLVQTNICTIEKLKMDLAKANEGTINRYNHINYLTNYNGGVQIIVPHLDGFSKQVLLQDAKA